MNVARADEDAIRAHLSALFDRWNAGDAEGYADLFTDDGDYVVFDGTHLVGREQNVAVHRPLFAGILRGSVMEGTVTDVRLLANDVAVAHGEGGVRLRWHRTTPASRRAVQTYVLVRADGGWKIAAFQNTRSHKSWFHRLMTWSATRS